MSCLLETGPSYCDLAVTMMVTAKAAAEKQIIGKGKDIHIFGEKSLIFKHAELYDHTFQQNTLLTCKFSCSMGVFNSQALSTICNSISIFLKKLQTSV